MKMHPPLKRLFVNFSLQSKAQGKASEAQYHYLAHVLRMKEREKVLIFNGEDGEWISTISYIEKSISFNVEHQTRPQTKPSDLHYIFSPIKTNRLDYMIQKSVEMGVSAIRPVITRYTQNTHCNVNRMRTYAISAAEQCNIISLPSIHPPITLDTLLENWDQNRHIVFADETCIHENSKIQAIAHIVHMAVLIGPEGGFHPKEKEKLHSLPFVTPISLGPRILRADTAAVAAMTLVQSTCGDWYKR
ncbi:16S rRNA methyltransferase [Candidatus Liberibacter solanacearum]|uniref:Ribosomal RNA small subunit methyltransferase E n=1 Tax=Candidatus Liberibacter solanacearum TaxID=556287 RepID=A0A095A0P1_9HYPH|nr:16S rRNA (uracil(1498)-N(3))-methyltransferase [Candidatus Liberibacter solanacearum]KGB27671.1 16S rRNA methyltransferase [Candidatus Liberibacter solanacearum]KJZ81191.1 16S rRNA methyltransferase [Candidatus Liberibacter solanacearum]KJZ81648.1 Ribosomal RNA small subunit methyltransferase E [Candidatus Liberibacter solanacearum]KQC48924.1 16S rRNA methyltransferase [Candidatus Liberibacter solanacearum]